MASSGGVNAGFEPRHLETSPPLSAGTSPEPSMGGHGMKPPPPPPPPPHRLLPPDFRNGDFLHRLLAATPPYLYSMPLLPHSFFFSDMLKSFVAGKPPVPPPDGTPPPPNPSSTPPKDHPHHPPPHQQHHGPGGLPPPPLDLMNPANKDMLLMPSRPPHRRRKRSWRDIGEPQRKISASSSPINMSIIPDKPLELTTTNRSSSAEDKSPRPPSSPAMRGTPDPPSTATSTPVSTPPPIPQHPLLLPGLHHCGMLPPGLSEGIPPPSELLPALLPSPTAPFPPPPLWFPSLYPGLPPPPPPPPPPPQTPFGGIDPLHFFIDLRVSGHIWDRNKQAANLRGGGDKAGDEDGSENGEQGMRRALEDGQISPGSSTSSDPASFPGGVHQSKHCSAFTVPEARERKRLAMSHIEEQLRKEHSCRSAPTANYVLQNLSRIYREVQGRREASAAAAAAVAASVAASPPVTKEETREEEESEARTEAEGGGEIKRESGDEGEAPVKDLPALIGLELVVDYVKHDGKGGRKGPGPSTEAPTGPHEVAEGAEEVIDP
ncbi:proline-rich protein 12 [Ischnura elegans]|uniref:proline-rich protein 12 n=1 Tax=Ischnura elegans TaxID=197161 RepID=UPI001ED86787|nr:proline-rich protein 12 [Ischnura elegans]